MVKKKLILPIIFISIPLLFSVGTATWYILQEKEFNVEYDPESDSVNVGVRIPKD